MATVLVECRLSALAPGGVDFTRLSYNPVSGALRLEGVRARDAAGRTVFTSPRIAGRVDLGGVLGGHVVLRGLEVVSPRIVIASWQSDVVDLADGGAWARLGTPLTVEGVMVTDGTLIARDGRPDGGEILARGIDVRLDRLEAASPRGWTDAAFMVQMTAYGTTVHLTGRPRPSGDYALHVRAHDADLVAWLRDFPLAGVAAAPGAHGELDATITVADGRATISGAARGGPVAMALGPEGQVRARDVHVVFDGVDPATRVGRLSTIHLQSPSVTLVTHGPDRILGETRGLVTRLVGNALRRLTVVDGDVTLVTPSGARLARVVGVTVGLDARPRRDSRDLVVSAAGRVGAGGRVSLHGVVRPREGSFDGEVHLADLALGGLGAPLVSPERASEGALSFNGHVNVVDADGVTSASVAAARMTWRAPVRRDFRAEALTVALRRYDWPRGIAVIDSLTLTRPAWSALDGSRDGVTLADVGAGVVVTQSVAEPTPLDGLLAAVETASRAYQSDDGGAADRAGLAQGSRDFPSVLPRLP
jgi:hypothetical protein